MKLNYAVHTNILIQILKDIYTHSDLAPYLGFKGGTAAFFFYHLDRFSIDLDFDLLQEVEKEKIYSIIKNIIKKYGVIKDERIKRYSIFFLLSYENDLPNIKIEINLRNFDSKYELKNYLGIPMLVMVREDMFAHKLVAMYERLGKANRDIFDVHFFLKNRWPINVEIIENRTKNKFSQFLKKCTQELEKLETRNILNGIGELINQDQKRWAKQHLLNDTVFLLKSREIR